MTVYFDEIISVDISYPNGIVGVRITYYKDNPNDKELIDKLNSMNILEKYTGRKKLIILADLRGILPLLDREEITMSRAAELLNIAANERYKEHTLDDMVEAFREGLNDPDNRRLFGEDAVVDDFREKLLKRRAGEEFVSKLNI